MHRVLASAISAFTPTTAINLAWLQGFLLLILLLHCTCQPYKEMAQLYRRVNFYHIGFHDSHHFYCLFQADTTNSPPNDSFWIQIILMYCPLVYFILLKCSYGYVLGLYWLKILFSSYVALIIPTHWILLIYLTVVNFQLEWKMMVTSTLLPVEVPVTL